jgi:hypothetical protein
MERKTVAKGKTRKLLKSLPKAKSLETCVTGCQSHK